MNKTKFIHSSLVITMRILLLVSFALVYVHIINCSHKKEYIRVKDKQLYFTCTQLYNTKKEILDCIADRYTLFMDILNGTGREVNLIEKERLDFYTIIETYEICYSNKRFCEYIQVVKTDKHLIVEISEYSFFILIGVILKSFLLL